MAPAVHGSDSDGTNSESSPRKSKSQVGSPEQPGQSDQPGPADSDGDSEVYEIEAILDAKRGATGSTRIGYLVKWKNYPDEENSWVDERDAAGAKELITEYWSRQGKKKGEKAGRKSEPKPKAATRRPVAASVESTPEPAQGTKKRGRDRQKAKPSSDDEGAEEEEDTRSKKRGRRSNGITRRVSPSPTPSSEMASPVVELIEPSTIKKWGNLPSWERHIEAIDTVERTDDGDLVIYFKLKGEKTACKENSRICAEKFPQELIKFYEAHLKWKQAEAGHESN